MDIMVLGIFALLLLANYPVLGAVVILFGVIWLVGRNKDSSTATVTYDEPAPEPSRVESKPETGMFYRGTCTALTSPIYSYRNGCIFKGVNYGTDMLNFYEYTYANGFVRDRAGSVVGRYRDGYICLGRGDAWISDAKACCARGYVHEGTYAPELYVGNAIGTYTGDDEGAAACAVAMLLEG